MVCGPVTEGHPTGPPLVYNTPLKLCKPSYEVDCLPGLNPHGIYMAVHIMALFPVVAKKMIYGCGGNCKWLLC